MRPEIKAWFAGTTLNVRASEPIERLQVCDAGGAVLVSASPRTETAEIDMSRFQASIYLVNVSTRGCTTTFKLTR